jgi:hypothetical protein
MRTLALATALAAITAPTPARACGGCFQPPDSVSSVTDHRMVIALSNQQTTLWDQIRYTGSPGDFVWVLPTPQPADVQLAAPEFFDTLEQNTAPVIYGPPRAQPSGGGVGFGCGSAGSAGPAPENENVTVYHQGQVGPYETATVGSADPQALTRWLNDHGYAVPDALKPTIAWYVGQGWVFNALRLKPDASTSQMRPVRVIFPGLAATFPLRMVAAGATEQLGILLWVIADQRYRAGSYDTVTIDDKRLIWSTGSNRSNYREIFAATIAEHPAGAFVTEYSDRFDKTYFPAAAMDDVLTAGAGQGSTIRLTRLRTSLSPSLLTRDLTLVPDASNAAVGNIHQLSQDQQQSQPFAVRERRSRTVAGALALLLVVALARRRLRRRV